MFPFYIEQNWNTSLTTSIILNDLNWFESLENDNWYDVNSTNVIYSEFKMISLFSLLKLANICSNVYADIGRHQLAQFCFIFTFCVFLIWWKNIVICIVNLSQRDKN